MIGKYIPDLSKVKMNRSNMIFLVLFTLIALVAAYFMYKKYVSPQNYVANKEFVVAPPTDKEPNVDLYFFYTSWCPHCKTAFPVWNSLKGENIKGVNFIEIDCDKDTDTADKFKIKGYPTIKMVKNNQMIEYDAKPDLDTLKQFINSY